MQILYDYNAYQLGIPLGIDWTPGPTSPCHFLVVGPSETGKTWVSGSVCARICLHIENSRLYIADYKGDDFFAPFHAHPDSNVRYGRYNQAVSIIEDFFAVLERRLAGATERNFSIIWIDEVAALISSLPKKDSDAVRTKIATILQVGRSMNCQCLLSLQRPDSHFLENGSRESAGMVLYLGGKISKEAAAMLSFQREELPPIQGRAGYLSVNGAEPRAVQIPIIHNTAKLLDALQVGITR